jgi:polyisoprenoid-binding protein YceI
MKTLFFAIVFAAFQVVSAQSFVDTKGKVHFFSKTPVEDIEAVSKQTVCALNTENKKIFAKIPIKSFEFRDKLMQEHFNENYLESDKIPFSSLDAIINENIDFTKDGTYEVTLKGVLDLHGVKNEVEIPGKLIVKNGVPTSATAEFTVALKDYKIKVPKIVAFNIAETIKIDVAFEFVKYEKK